MNRAKAAHLVDRVNDPNATPTAFTGWVTVAVQMWARLSPSRRAQEREKVTLPAAGDHFWFTAPKVHNPRRSEDRARASDAS